MVWKSFKIAKPGYNADYFRKDADEINRHHFNDDFHLYVTSYTEEGANGFPYIVGITVGADEDPIDWFVRGWIERGILKAVEE